MLPGAKNPGAAPGGNTANVDLVWPETFDLNTQLFPFVAIIYVRNFSITKFTLHKLRPGELSVLSALGNSGVGLAATQVLMEQNILNFLAVVVTLAITQLNKEKYKIVFIMLYCQTIDIILIINRI